MTPSVAMRIRFARWRALAAVARLAHRWSRSGARRFAWSARHASALAERLSAPAAVATAAVPSSNRRPLSECLRAYRASSST